MLPAETVTVSVAEISPTLQDAPGEVMSCTGAFSVGLRTALLDAPELVSKVEKTSVFLFKVNQTLLPLPTREHAQ